MDLAQQNILAEFVCPGCRNFLHPPIFTCPAGHPICILCSRLATQCPYCHAPISPTKRQRNTRLEMMHQTVLFPCCFARMGCSLLLPGMYIYDHMIRCRFGFIPCPFRDEERCTLVAPVAVIVNHLNVHHPTATFKAKSRDVVCYSFFRHTPHGPVTTLPTVMVHLNVMFKCIMQVDHTAGVIRWFVYELYIIKPARPIVICFYIQLSHQGQEEGAEIMMQTCPQVPFDTELPVRPEHAIEVKEEKVRSFCPDGNLAFKIWLGG